MNRRRVRVVDGVVDIDRSFVDELIDAGVDHSSDSIDDVEELSTSAYDIAESLLAVEGIFRGDVGYRVTWEACAAHVNEGLDRGGRG